jgi:hypothetical protein
MSFSGSRQCKCPRFSFNPTAQPARELIVLQRNQNRSSYNGHVWQTGGQFDRLVKESRWSHVLCLTCGWHWRTQAAYPDRLPDVSAEVQELCYRHLRDGKPADAKLLRKIYELYNRPLFPARSSPAIAKRARKFSGSTKRAIAGRSRR